MRIGYARVSTSEQNPDLQKDALTKAGCEKIIEDTASGSKQQRSGLERARSCCGKVTCWWCGGSTGWAGHSNISSS